MKPDVQVRQKAGGVVREIGADRWRLEIPAGAAGTYRWAQLDDYMACARKDFAWYAPLRMQLRARVSAADLPGTWGFGLWNDPFSASFGVRGAGRRLPALPNAAWFFFAGQPNYLALRDNHPAQGFLAGAFAAAQIPSLLFLPGVVALPLLALPPAARLLRRAARLLLYEDSARVPVDPTGWHDYQLDWHSGQAVFFVDGGEIFRTRVAPRAPLGAVIWVDNQYAAFPPSGRLRMGTSPNPEPAWMELEGLDFSRID